MNVYVDSSVVLRIILSEPDPLPEWADIQTPVSSELLRVEVLRAIDRARIRLELSDQAVARQRGNALEAISAVDFVPLGPAVIERAADPFPTLVGSLDAIHLATVVLVRDELEEDVALATHDHELAIAARALGFEVLG